MLEHLSSSSLSNKLDISQATLAKEVIVGELPKPNKVGNRNYFSVEKINKTLSEKAGKPVSILNDRLYSGKSIERLFQKSHAWVWLKFIKDKKRKAKGIRIRSRLYFLESDIQADQELSKYLELLESEKVQEVA